MRGMIEGVWHADLKRDEIEQDADLAEVFESNARRVPIDTERLADAPQSYHLYVALACPFAHRAILGRTLCGVDLPMTLVGPWLGGPKGWSFDADPSAPMPEATALWEIYRANDATYSGRVTVPVLWDRETDAIASTESDEILTALLTAHQGRTAVAIATTGDGLGAQCAWVKDRINVGVYRVGFARSQQAYDLYHAAFVDALHHLNGVLHGREYVWGDCLSLADLLVFPTAVRFDAGYQGAFHIHDVRWRDFANLQAHMERIAKLPGVAKTVVPDDYRRHYFDDGVFPLRHPGPDGHYIVPRTSDPF